MTELKFSFALLLSCVVVLIELRELVVGQSTTGNQYSNHCAQSEQVQDVEETMGHMKEVMSSEFRNVHRQLQHLQENVTKMVAATSRTHAEPDSTKNGRALQRTLAEGRPIWGVTSLSKELFVVRHLAAEIEVYNIGTYSLQRRLAVPGLGSGNDLTADRVDRCLYVSDWGSSKVFRVDPSGNQTTSWSVSDKPHCSSVTFSSNILVTFKMAGKIKEYTPSGTLVREIRLESDITNPMHAVELSHGQYVVSHGDHINDTLHRVVVVGDDGRILRQYGGQKGSGIGQLNTPTSLSVNGFVLVDDLNNDRIIILSPDLTYIRQVASTGLNAPVRMWVDVHNGLLFVADNRGWNSTAEKYESGNVKVFEF